MRQIDRHRSPRPGQTLHDELSEGEDFLKMGDIAAARLGSLAARVNGDAILTICGSIKAEYRGHLLSPEAG